MTVVTAWFFVMSMGLNTKTIGPFESQRVCETVRAGVGSATTRSVYRSPCYPAPVIGWRNEEGR